MLEKVNGGEPAVTSSTYTNVKGAGVSVKSVTDSQQPVTSKVKSSSQKLDGKEKQPDNEQVKEAVEKLNTDIRFKKTGCEFKYHEECNRVSIKLYDTETKEVIREIPSADTIKMLEKLNEIAGLMIDERL